MSKIVELKKDIKLAMKDKDKFRVTILRIALSALENEKVNLKLKDVGELSDVQLESVLMKQVKMLDQELESLVSIGRDTSNVEEQKSIIEEYLPKQLTESEINSIIKGKIEQLNIGSIKEQGKLMGILSKELKGKADMGIVSKLVRENLN